MELAERLLVRASRTGLGLLKLHGVLGLEGFESLCVLLGHHGGFFDLVLKLFPGNGGLLFQSLELVFLLSVLGFGLVLEGVEALLQRLGLSLLALDLVLERLDLSLSRRELGFQGTDLFLE